MEEGILRISLKEYKQQIDELRASMLYLESTSDEYQQKAQEVAQMQGKLNEVMRVGKQDAQAVDGSYNALQKRLTDLKKEWKNLDMGSKAYKEAGKEIANITKQLKEEDAKIGDFKRNVGDYANQFTSAFGAMGSSMGGLKSAIGGVTNAFKALWGNPWVALIGAVVFAVQQLVEAFKRNDDASRELQKTFGGFKAVFTLMQQGFDKLVVGITNFLGKLDEIERKISESKIGQAFEDLKNKVFGAIEKIANTKWGKKIGLDDFLSNIKESYEKANETTEEIYKKQNDILALEKRIATQRRNATMQNANDEEEISKLRIIVADKEGKTAEERQEALEKIDELNKKIAERNIALYTSEYQLIQSKNQLTKSSEQDMQAEADAYARIVQARIQLNNQLAQSTKQEAKVASDAEKDKKDDYEAEKTRMENQKSLIEVYLSKVREGSEEEITLTKQKIEIERQLKIKEAEFKIKDANDLREAIKVINAEFDAEEEEAEQEHQDKLRDIENQRYSNKTGEAKLGNDRMAVLQAELEEAQHYYETLEQMQNESNEAYRARQIEALQNVKEAEKAINEERINTYTTYADAVSNLLGNVAEVWQNHLQMQVNAGKMSEAEAKKQFEKTKGLQIAQTWIQGFSGIATALATAMELGPIAGPIVGAINSAAVLAATIANTQKIKSTTFNGSSSGGGGGSTTSASVAPIIQQYTPQQTAFATSASGEESLSNAISKTNIWVSVKDIDNAQNRVRVREEESEF